MSVCFRAAIAMAALFIGIGCSGIGGSSGGGGQKSSTSAGGGGLFTANEGSPTNPVPVTVGQSWVGMVSGGTSYYVFQKDSGSSVVATLTPNNTGPIDLGLLLTNQASFAAVCPAWNVTLNFVVPATQSGTFNSSCALGNTTANQAWYLAITLTGGQAGTDYSLTITTP
jgi:hypothetical protein